MSIKDKLFPKSKKSDKASTKPTTAEGAGESKGLRIPFHGLSDGLGAMRGLALKNFEALRRLTSKEIQAATDGVGDMVQLPDDVQYLSLYTLVSVLARRWRVFVAIILIGVIIAGTAFYIPSTLTSSTIMSLNYEESADGKNPNGTRYNLYELRSLDVATRAIELLGLQDEIDPQDIVDNLSIDSYGRKNYTSNQDYYISSSYTVSFKKRLFKTAGVSSKDMLSMICKAYKEKFFDEHITTAKVLENFNFDYENMDYSDMLDFFELMLDRTDRYLDSRINQAGNFSDSNGSTFKSLRKRVTNLQTYELATFDSYVWENGIAVDKVYMIDKLTYDNHIKLRTYNQNMRGNQMRLKTIEEYNQSMTSSILIPTYDNDNQFYMARTKTGIDDIAKDANRMLTRAEEVALQMSMNSDKIVKLGKPAVYAQYTTANTMATEIENKLEDIIDDITALDNSYTLQKTRNYITFEERKTSFASKIHIKRLAAIAAVLFCLVYIFFVAMKKRALRIALRNMISERKKNKENGGAN